VGEVVVMLVGNKTDLGEQREVTLQVPCRTQQEGAPPWQPLGLWRPCARSHMHTHAHTLGHSQHTAHTHTCTRSHTLTWVRAHKQAQFHSFIHSCTHTHSFLHPHILTPTLHPHSCPQHTVCAHTCTYSLTVTHTHTPHTQIPTFTSTLSSKNSAFLKGSGFPVSPRQLPRVTAGTPCGA
jgi:hypothetical protein